MCTHQPLRARFSAVSARPSLLGKLSRCRLSCPCSSPPCLAAVSLAALSCSPSCLTAISHAISSCMCRSLGLARQAVSLPSLMPALITSLSRRRFSRRPVMLAIVSHCHLSRHLSLHVLQPLERSRSYLARNPVLLPSLAALTPRPVLRPSRQCLAPRMSQPSECPMAARAPAVLAALPLDTSLAALARRSCLTCCCLSPPCLAALSCSPLLFYPHCSRPLSRCCSPHCREA